MGEIIALSSNLQFPLPGCRNRHIEINVIGAEITLVWTGSQGGTSAGSGNCKHLSDMFILLKRKQDHFKYSIQLYTFLTENISQATAL